MKSTVAPYATSTKCLRIECTNGTTIRLTRYPFDLTMSNATVYKTDSGYDFTSYSAESGLAASVVDLEGIVDVAGLSRDGMRSGVFDGARCYLFACDYLNPVEDYEPIVSSILGKTTINDDRYTIEDMALIDLLNQSVGDTYTTACQKTFGGTEFGGCQKSLAAITVNGAVTSVSSTLVIRDSSRTEAADYFGAGTIEFTSGPNVGLAPVQIRDYAADGTITMYEPPYYTVTVGTTFTLVPGCRKRIEDCRDKFGNILRFGGYPWIPVGSAYRQVGGEG
jgi:uncharacterized phage protein (TIGR02218 family)